MLAAEQPALENYLEKVGEEERSVLLRELLLIELHYLDRLGQIPISSNIDSDSRCIHR